MSKVPSGQGQQQGTFLILSLDPPLRRGQTMYHHLVFHFADKEDEEEVAVELPKNFDWKDIPPKMKDSIKPTMMGKGVDILATLFQFLSLASDSKLKLYDKSQFRSDRDSGEFAVMTVLGLTILLQKALVCLLASVHTRALSTSWTNALFSWKCDRIMCVTQPPQVIMYEQVDTIVFDRKDTFTQVIGFCVFPDPDRETANSRRLSISR
eukprot:768557-Hanusia_phi.AAC.7